MDHIFIYRWEHCRLRKGPYNCSGIAEFVSADIIKKFDHDDCLFEHTDDNHPSIFKEYNLINSYRNIDSINRIPYIVDEFHKSRYEFLFGFKDLNQMQSWFNEFEIALMKEAGFVLKCFKIKNNHNKYLITPTQVLFKKSIIISSTLINYENY